MLRRSALVVRWIHLILVGSKKRRLMRAHFDDDDGDDVRVDEESEEADSIVLLFQKSIPAVSFQFSAQD